MANMSTPNFSRSKMACRCGCGRDEMDQEFMRMLQALRDEIGPMPVTSGFSVMLIIMMSAPLKTALTP